MVKVTNPGYSLPVIKRIKEDYFIKNRLPSYDQLLRYAKEQGYIMVGILDFYRNTQMMNASLFGERKILVNRHDIDTSPKVARQMFEIEKSVYGKQGSATYYFRNSTIDKRLIAEIERYGYETGYHYEEIADYEKSHKTKSSEKILRCLPEIREEFIKDIKQYRSLTRTSSVSVASHGDFINAKYHIPNYTLMDDESIRKKSGIVVEAYDEQIMKYVKRRFADHKLLDNFSPEVINEIGKGTQTIMLLTHPRYWKVDFMATTRENIKRMIQGIKYMI